MVEVPWFPLKWTKLIPAVRVASENCTEGTARAVAGAIAGVECEAGKMMIARQTAIAEIARIGWDLGMADSVPPLRLDSNPHSARLGRLPHSSTKRQDQRDEGFKRGPDPVGRSQPGPGWSRQLSGDTLGLLVASLGLQLLLLGELDLGGATLPQLEVSLRELVMKVSAVRL